MSGCRGRNSVMPGASLQKRDLYQGSVSNAGILHQFTPRTILPATCRGMPSANIASRHEETGPSYCFDVALQLLPALIRYRPGRTTITYRREAAGKSLAQSSQPLSARCRFRNANKRAYAGALDPEMESE